MEIGRAEIVVVAGMMMGVIMVMPMIIAMPVMVMPAHQEQRAGDIDREAQHRNQRGAREIDAHGIEEAEEGFDRDPEREDAEAQRRGEAGQIRSAERREVKECVSTCRSRGAPLNSK